MNEQELVTNISHYILKDWKTIIGIVLSISAFLVTATWMVTRFLYLREICFLKQNIETNKDLYAQKNNYLSLQLEEKNIYAQGILQLTDQRILVIEEEKKILLKDIERGKRKLIDIEKSNKVEEETKRDLWSDSDWGDSLEHKQENIEIILSEIDGSKPIFIRDHVWSNNIKREYSNDYFREECFRTISLLTEEIIKARLKSMKYERKIFISYSNRYEGLNKIIKPFTYEKTGNKEQYTKILKEFLEGSDSLEKNNTL